MVKWLKDLQRINKTKIYFMNICLSIQENCWRIGYKLTVLTTREELKIEAGREAWKKLIAQGWRKTPVVW